MAKFEYLLIKRNGNKDRLVYDKRVFTNSKEARKDFRVNDIILRRCHRKILQIKKGNCKCNSQMKYIKVFWKLWRKCARYT
jgi:hypothetical protein